MAHMIHYSKGRKETGSVHMLTMTDEEAGVLIALARKGAEEMLGNPDLARVSLGGRDAVSAAERVLTAIDPSQPANLHRAA